MQVDIHDHRIAYTSLSDPSPAAAEGFVLLDGPVAGRFHYEWDFYARWDHWCFALSTDPNMLPSASDCYDKSELASAPHLFVRSGKYGESADASYMPVNERQRLIRQCIAEFFECSKVAEGNSPS